MSAMSARIRTRSAAAATTAATAAPPQVMKNDAPTKKATPAGATSTVQATFRGTRRAQPLSDKLTAQFQLQGLGVALILFGAAWIVWIVLHVCYDDLTCTPPNNNGDKPPPHEHLCSAMRTSTLVVQTLTYALMVMMLLLVVLLAVSPKARAQLTSEGWCACAAFVVLLGYQYWALRRYGHGRGSGGGQPASSANSEDDVHGSKSSSWTRWTLDRAWSVPLVLASTASLAVGAYALYVA